MRRANGVLMSQIMEDALHTIGKNETRLGLADKVRGTARYTADLKRPDMLYGKILRCPHPHARIVALDTLAAERSPGVHAVGSVSRNRSANA